MVKRNKFLVEGTNDILFKQCEIKNDIIGKIRNVFKGYGFLEIQTPTLEFYDVFNFDNHPIDDEKIYKLIDYKSRIVVLRPDFTIPIARVYSSKIKEGTYKLCYFGQVYRANEHNYGKNNEITQCGLEIIGSNNTRAEVLLIVTAIEALKSIGLDDFKIEIGQCEFYKGLMEDLDFTEEEKSELQKYIINKNIGALNRFLDYKKDNLDKNTYELLRNLPQLFGGTEVLDEVEDYIKSKKTADALEEIRYIYEMLKNLGYEKYIFIDLSLIQDFNYYTGVIFKGYVKDLGEEILSGGRYNSLMSEFGIDAPAVGLGINIDNILKIVSEKNNTLDEGEEGIVYFDREYFKEALDEVKKSNGKLTLSVEDTFEDAVEDCRRRQIKNLILINKDGIFKYFIGEKDVIRRDD